MVCMQLPLHPPLRDGSTQDDDNAGNVQAKDRGVGANHEAGIALEDVDRVDGAGLELGEQLVLSKLLIHYRV